MPSSPPTAAAVLVAAGRSTRMGAGERKPFLRIATRTLLEHACAAFQRVDAVRAIVIVAHADDVERIQALVEVSGALSKVTAVVAGGAERTDSVRLGVAALGDDVDLVLVHDAARALIQSDTIERAIEVAARDGAALVAVPVRDTIKRSPDGEHASETIERSHLWAAQTPQAFRLVQFRDVLARAERDGYVATDDAALHERYVGAVTLVRGEETNLKITTPEDLVLAEAILAQREGAR